MNTVPLWQPPSMDTILAGIEQLRANHPATVMLTISLKLRTSRFKEHVLRMAQQRVTNMKAEVLEIFRHDLGKITSGAAGMRLVDAIVDLIRSDVHSIPGGGIEGLRRGMLAMALEIDPLTLPVAIVQAVADVDGMGHEDMRLLRAYLDGWHTDNPDTQLSNTLKRAAERKKPSSTLEDEPRYTREQIERIKYAILLRKALQRKHVAQLQTQRIAALAEFAELSYRDTAQAQQLDAEINKRSVGQLNERLIDVLCTHAGLPAAAEEGSGAAVQQLRDTLRALYKNLTKRRGGAHKGKDTTASASERVSLIRQIIRELATDSSAMLGEGGIRWFRDHLEQWHAELDKPRQKLLQEKMQGEHDPDAGQRIRYAVLLRAYLEERCTLSTDVLVLVELAEAITRQIGDGSELLSSILSRCYGETCSKFKYPLTGVLRQSTFVGCAENILGWCQRVIDYKAERDWKQLRNQMPPWLRSERPNFCRIYPFRGKRIIRLPLIHSIWCDLEAAYSEAAATVVPIGPDVGKTLGNTEGRFPRSRKGKGRRRTSILGDRFIGKRGARRLKRWLLPSEVVASTLEHLEVLEYPELFTERRLDEAKAAPHPYWVAKRQQGRSVKAVRPSQFPNRSTNRPARLGQLSTRQRYMLRIQLRELQAFAPQFIKIRHAIDRFTEPAPPEYPRVDRVIFTEREAQQLPFEAQVGPSEVYEARKRAYEQDVDVFSDFRPRRGDPFDSYSPEKLYDIETLRAQSLERSAAALLSGTAQPIAFHRTMSCELEPKAFTLLMFGRERNGLASERYIFACELAGEEAPERAELTQRDHGGKMEPREFVNYPGHYIEGHENSSLVFFAVEIGDAYQGRILRELCDRQKQALFICKKGCTYSETGQHLPSCAPKAAIATATITNTTNSRRHDEWFVHLPIPMPTPPCVMQPDAVIGFHEYEGNFYFAVISFQGQLLDVGEVAVPDNVGLHTRHGKTSENFAYEVAWGILRQSRAEHYTACVGIENTAWRRENIDVSAERNAQHFAFPREHIAAIVDLKAAQEGLLPPVKVRGISPARDCGHCGHRLESGSGVRVRTIWRCPHCDTLGLRFALQLMEEGDVARYRCTTCKRTWGAEAPQFKCQRCGVQRYARYNTAIVVARRILVGMSEPERQENEGGSSSGS